MKPAHELVVDLLPPAAWRLFRKFRPAKPSERSAHRAICEGAYATFAEATAAAANDYEDSAIVDALHAKTLTYRDLLATRPLTSTPAVERVATVLAVVSAGVTELRVIDFGGGFGTHYWIARSLLGDRVRLRWHVVETPATCERSSIFANEELRFFSSIEAARKALDSVDLLYSDGVLQVLPDPISTLRELVACGARYLCLQRIATSDALVHTVVKIPLSLHEPDVPLPEQTADRITSIPVSYETPEHVERELAAAYDVELRFGGRTPVYRHERFTMYLYGYLARQRLMPSTGR